MKYTLLDFHCKMTSNGFLSAYKGSMLRGAIGSALRRMCCNMRSVECDSCPIIEVCQYQKLFESKKVCDDYQSLPTVYCIRPSDDLKTSYKDNDDLNFQIALFSYGTEFIPYYVQAVISSGKTGLGKHINGQSVGTFVIKDIICDNNNIFDFNYQKILQCNIENLSFPEWDSSLYNCDAKDIIVTFETPCRFKKDKHFSSNIPFSELMLLILRRLRNLWRLDGQDCRINDFTEFMRQASEVKMKASTLAWKDWNRWSNKQKESMKFGGVIGNIAYADVPASFLPLLRLGEKLQIGKQTSFGLGRFTVATRS